MVEVPGWLVITLEQAIIILIILAAVFFFRVKKLKRQIADLNSKKIPQVINQPAPQAINQPVPPMNSAELAELAEKVALYEQSLRNLEKFRDMFFEMKSKYEAYGALQQEVLGQVTNALPDDESTVLLKQSFEKLKREKELLEQHLKQVEAELDILMEDSPPAGSGDTEAEANAPGINNMLDDQQAEIQRLKQYVVDLTMEAAVKDQIGTALGDLEKKNKDMGTALEILQDENQFLQDQVKVLLKVNKEPDDSATKLAAQQKTLNERDKELSELKKKFTSLETEYLKLSSNK